MPQAPDVEGIDQALQSWRQGDVVLRDVPYFLHLADLSHPLTKASSEASQDAGPLVGADTLAGIPTIRPGLVILSQTCDLVRSCIGRPLVEVCPLVAVSDQELEDIRRLRRPAFAFVPGVADLNLVADLDMPMAMEKAILARLTRVPGCQTDAERKEFADALARKRARFAFPDDFVAAMSKVKRRLKDRHSRETDEGTLARAINEIRVIATPDWDAETVSLTFLFIMEDEASAPNPGAQSQVSDWVERLDTSGRFQLHEDLPWRLCFLADLDATIYRDSDRLDLDDLSTSRASTT